MKKAICAILALLLIVSLGATVYADMIIDIGEWSLAKSPGGKAWEIRSYNGNDTEITLIDNYGSMNVCTIGSHAFSNDSTITSITFNENMQIINDYAFLNCAVSNILLNVGLIELGKGAFSGTSNLIGINLQDTRVQELPEYAFLNSGLTTITLPDVMHTIGAGAFMQCTALTEVLIPDSVTVIEENAFDGCENLTIIANRDSYAIEYAIENEIPYKFADNSYLIGDADNDQDVTIFDVTKIQCVLANLDDDPDGMIALRGDINGDGLTILDATAIQRFLAFLSTNPAIKTIAYY